jgi:hypothetical protein
LGFVPGSGDATGNPPGILLQVGTGTVFLPVTVVANIATNQIGISVGGIIYYWFAPTATWVEVDRSEVAGWVEVVTTENPGWEEVE